MPMHDLYNLRLLIYGDMHATKIAHVFLTGQNNVIIYTLILATVNMNS